MMSDATAVDPDLGESRDLDDHGIPARSEARVYHSTAIVAGDVTGQNLGHRGPIAFREARIQAFVHLRRRVFQPRLPAG